MPKWTDRARKAMGQSQKDAINSIVEKTINEARTIATDIQFVVESSGVQCNNSLTYDDHSVTFVETFYRTRMKLSEPIEFGTENFERLLSLYLGQTLVERKQGQWITYEGKYHVVFPAVIKLNNGKHVDVFLFCTSLYSKLVAGAREGNALLTFIENVDHFSFL